MHGFRRAPTPVFMKAADARGAGSARRRVWLLHAAILPVVVLAGCTTTKSMIAPRPAAIWTADAGTNGVSAWQGFQSPPARLRITDDPAGLYGKVYIAYLLNGDTWSGDGTARAEFYGTDLPNGIHLTYVEGSDYYFGWRSMISRGNYYSGSGNLGNLVQFKGDSDCGGPAVGLTLENSRVALRSEVSGIFWEGPLASKFAGSWHSFVVHIHFSTGPTTGFVELWLDGVPQTFTDGTQHHVMATMCPADMYEYLKMGFYRGTKITGYGDGYHWIDTPRLGTSYGAVVPR